MLEIIILLILVSFIGLGFGIFFSSTFKIDFNNPIRYFYFGLFWVAITERIISFYHPINAIIFLFFLITSVFFFFFKKAKAVDIFNQINSVFKTNRALIIFAGIFVIYFSSLSSVSYDEGLYHAGFIAWVNKFSIVKGLPNLEIRFGLNSNWHFLQALFNGFQLLPVVSNSLNSFLILSFIFFFLFEFPKSSNKLFLIFLFLPNLLVYHLIDPSTDLVIIFFTIAFVSDVLLKQEKKYDLFWLFAFPFLITVKANFIMLSPLFIVYLYQLNFFKREFIIKHFTKLFIYLFFLIGTWVLSNILLSGFVFFPYFELSHFNFIWKISTLEKIDFQNGVNYSIINRYTGLQSSQIAQFSKLASLHLWWTSVRLLDQLLFLISVFSFGLFIFLNRKSKYKVFVAVVIFFAFVANFLLSFDFRFYGGPVVSILFCLSFTPLVEKFITKFTYFILLILIFEFSTSYFLYVKMYHKSYVNKPLSNINIINKAGYVYSEMKPVIVNGINLYFPIGSEFTWDSIPSISHESHNLYKIGATNAEGFYKKN
jgi:hypothetical protein